MFSPDDDALAAFIFAQRDRTGRKPRTETKPLPQIRGRREDGVLWVRAEDVADALESQAPTVNRRLISRLRG